MKSFRLVRYVVGVSILALLLAGCGGSQPPVVAPGAMPQSSAIATHADRGGSWMLPGTSSQDLLYVSDAYKNVFVLTYPEGKLVGELTGFNQPLGECADSAGNVFVLSYTSSFNATNIFEYAHGGTMPIATLSDPYVAGGCSVDPTTGNLAASGNGNIAIFPNASGKPEIFSSAEYSFLYCGYDNRGNLYISATVSSGSVYQLVRFTSAGKGSFETIKLSVPSLRWLRVLAIRPMGWKAYNRVVKR